MIEAHAAKVGTHPAKLNVPAKKKIDKGRIAKLKSSSWYQGAARSIGISKGGAVRESR
jgi:hypothetical protein